MPGTPFRLTSQRKKILELLCRYSYLRTSHFYDLLSAQSDGSRRAVRRLLRDFWVRRYLKRKPIVDYRVTSPFPRYENIFWLSRSGLFLARDCGFREGITTPEKSPHTLEHEATITEFHLAVEQVANSNHLELYWQQHNLKRSVNPDALFALIDPRYPEGESTFYYFLEVEKSREGNYHDGESALMRKLERYFGYQGTSDCRRDWIWFDEFRVLILVTNETQQHRLLERLAPRFPLRMFWVASERMNFAELVFRTPLDYRTAAYSLLADRYYWSPLGCVPSG